MLTQRVPQLHCDYLQTHGSPSDSKASPLALLAATCSSIGKSDNDKTKGTVLKPISPLPCNMSPIKKDNFKSPFKPYKQDNKPLSSSQRLSPSVISEPKSISICSSLKLNSMFSQRISPITSQSNTDKVKGCYLDGNRDSISPHISLKCHNTPLSSITGKMNHQTLIGNACHEHDCNRCFPTIRTSLEAVESRTTSSCPCALCNPSRPNLSDSGKCHYQLPRNYTPFKSSMGSSTCRNINCTSCTKVSHNTLQNFLHPALVHQCTHGTPSYVPIPHQPFDGYLKSSIGSKPFICNWVADGKHCGRGFASSEELFQHLRSHTSLQHQQHNQNNCDTHSTVSPQVKNSCSVHGCLCQSSPVTRSTTPSRVLPSFSYGPSMRFSPYSRGMASLPGTQSNYQGQSHGPHSIFHY